MQDVACDCERGILERIYLYLNTMQKTTAVGRDQVLRTLARLCIKLRALYECRALALSPRVPPLLVPVLLWPARVDQRRSASGAR